MSGCANAGQALSRSLKLYTSRTTCTLPFLYQTPTLRRYYSALQDLASENAPSPVRNVRIRKSKIPRESTSTTAPVTKKPESEDFVPFETPGATESAVVQDTIQGETLTGTERNAFAQLEALATSPQRPIIRKVQPVLSLDDVLNEAISAIEVMEQETTQPHDQNSTTTKTKSRGGALDLITAPDTAVSNPQKQDKKDWIPLTREDQRALTALQYSDTTDPMHWSVRRAKGQKEPEPLGSQTSTWKDLVRQNKRVLAALHHAPTDTQLWKILEKNVFHDIGLLHLDSPAPASATISPGRRSELMRIFPFYLTTAASILRTSFPTSNLVLSILPRTKQLGPSAYALATTPDLYNQLLAFHFEKFSDVAACNELLQEMEDNVIEPAPSTLQVLDYMLHFRNECVHGEKLGQAVKSLFTTEKYRREFGVLERWRGKVEQGLVEQQSRRQRREQKREMMEAGEDGEVDDAPRLSHRPLKNLLAKGQRPMIAS
ncbi:hypothetical protein E4T48_07141 [Aureobasidium sp. EXF-10727]|nr:hypothetical protein E4T48_07141 [Aureobasidium sp. EXF-10727]